MIYGYARVSTDGQSLEAQREQLDAAGAERVFAETASGAQTDRPQLKKAIAALKEGDTLVVTRLDRLARSTRDLLNVLWAVGEHKAGFKSLADGWADTTSAHGRLMVTILGGLAEFERELIKARTSEGRRRAKEAGRSLGRKHCLTPEQRRYVAAQRAGGASVRELARVLNVSPATVSRIPSKVV